MSHENRSIHCTVNECANHARGCEYCGLDCIEIGSHECSPSEERCTDCMSFRKA